MRCTIARPTPVPLKYAEQFIGILHVEASAVVADVEDPLTVDLARADLDNGIVAQPGVVERIVDEVDEHLPDQRCVAPDRRQVVYGDADAASGNLLPRLAQDLLDDRSGRHRLLG